MISTIDLLGRLKIFQQYLILYIQNWLSTKNILNVPIVNRCTPFNVNIQQCLLKQVVSTYLAWVMISLAIVIMLQLAGMQPISWVASCTTMTVEIRFLRDSQRLRRPATFNPKLNGNYKQSNSNFKENHRNFKEISASLLCWLAL